MTPTTPSLWLHEELMLLALRDDTGTVVSGTHYLFAIGGAVLAELLLAERLAVVEERKKKFAEVVSPKRVGEPLLDEWLTTIRSAHRRGTLQTWVSRIARTKRLKHRVATSLCRRGILRADEDQILLLFTRRVYPEVNPIPERRLVERLRHAVETDTPEVDSRTVVLVSLAQSGGLLKHALGRKTLRARKERLQQFTKGEVLGKATREAIEAVQAAAMVAAVLPTVIATSSATH